MLSGLMGSRDAALPGAVEQLSSPARFWLMTLLADLYGSLNDTLVRTVTDDEYRGRVMAVYSMIWGLTPIGNLEGARWRTSSGAGGAGDEWGVDYPVRAVALAVAG
ncbi:MAG: hypothetical protein U0232_10960 [Thermomicrobiales bacterium]